MQKVAIIRKASGKATTKHKVINIILSELQNNFRQKKPKMKLDSINISSRKDAKTLYVTNATAIMINDIVSCSEIS